MAKNIFKFFEIWIFAYQINWWTTFLHLHVSLKKKSKFSNAVRYKPNFFTVDRRNLSPLVLKMSLKLPKKWILLTK